MKKSNLKLLMAVLMCLVLALVVGCSGAPAGGSSQNGSGSDGGSDNQPSTQEGLPLTLGSNGNSYTINSFTIEEDESGNTNVTCKGSGFDVMPMVNGSFIIPVYCSVIEDGTETEFVSASMGGEGITFIFDKKLDPDTVVFYPEDDKETRTEVAA